MCADHCATTLLHRPDPHLPFPTKGQLVGRTAHTGAGLASTEDLLELVQMSRGPLLTKAHGLCEGHA